MGLPAGYFRWLIELELPDDEAARANAARDALLESLDEGGAGRGGGGSSVHVGDPSPGCSVCERGAWSCLFLNAFCTADCFYCPQDRAREEERPPIAEGLVFCDPAAYLDYLERFRFEGVAFSGGEVLLAFDRLLELVAGVRQRFGAGMHVWLYTNGDLLDAHKLRALAAAGLDEIRFNVSARGYDLGPVAPAREFVETVTVEVPAIPEDEERLRECVREMAGIGVDHLNLHQLFATEHNYRALAGRGYTFVPAEDRRDPPVIESELAALRLARRVLDGGLGVAVNYCSHAYKGRTHPLAARRRAAGLVRRSHERVTEAGYLASLAVRDSDAGLRSLAVALAGAGAAGSLWAPGEGVLFLHPSLLDRVAARGREVALRYDEARIGSRTRLGEEAFEVVGEVALGAGAGVCVGRKRAALLRRPDVAGRDGLPAAAEAFEWVGVGFAPIAGAGSLWEAWPGDLPGLS